jgi:hypothetical protein
MLALDITQSYEMNKFNDEAMKFYATDTALQERQDWNQPNVAE